jgi:dephospho-CoA kinase
VNSALIADRVFADDEAREKLEQIVYPYLNRAVEDFFDADSETSKCVAEVADAAKNYRFVEAALFSRAPELLKMLDEIWIVDAPENVRLQRLIARGLSESDASRRIENQRGACAPELFAGLRIRKITNDGDRSRIETQLGDLFKFIENGDPGAEAGMTVKNAL